MQADELRSPYAPIRYRTVAWWDYAMQVALHKAVSIDGRIALSLPDMILKQCVFPMIEKTSAVFKGRSDAGELLGLYVAKVLELRHWVPIASQYELCGRQIFDLTDQLVDMLKNTDLGECTLDGWHAPYNAFYVRFGMQPDMRLPYEEEEYEDTFEYLDGAFVAVTPWDGDPDQVRIKFGFTTVKSNGVGMSMPGYYIDFNPAEQKMSVPAAIEAAIKRRAADLEEPREESERALNAHRMDFINDSAELMRQASTLLINALFYIESIRVRTDFSHHEPGRDVPPEQVVEWMQAKPEKRRKLRSRLSREGYAIVKLLGKELQHSSDPRSSGGSVSAHWRRGHWRQQRVGPQLSQIERRWIKPTLVNAKEAVIEPPGHIYSVGATGSSNPIH